MGPGMGMLPMLGRELQLTDAQRAQIKSIADAHADEWKQLMDRSREAHKGLMQAITGDAVDEGLIRAKAAEAGLIEADIAVARAHAFAQVAQILTADQLAQLKQLEQNGPGRGRGGRGPAR
jgi:Spy/CpxP family protein refolding chaperone